MQTIYHAYHYDTSDKQQAAAYRALRDQLHALKLRKFCAWGGSSFYKPELDGQSLTLETNCLFSNQWNTAAVPGVSASGLRVFDWAEDYPIHTSGSIKAGHWLEQTPEMREVRRNTVKCHYCGAQEPAAKGYVFCPHCLDSPYLKADELHLTRMSAIDEWDQLKLAPLTEAERAHLLPLYQQAQTTGSTARGRARLAKFRADIETKYQRESKHAKIEHDGFLWLLDHGVGVAVIENCIYYSHTETFSFGWRAPVDDAVRSMLLDIISEFPFPYEIKCADGRKLNAV